jgi:GNAT superfamily N-acetyltransferase
VRIEVEAYRNLAAEDLEEWERLALKVHPPGQARLGSDLRWAPVEPTDDLIRVWDDGELRACAWVTTRVIDVAGRRTRIAGVRGVMTDPDHRRRGYGRAVMEQAHLRVRSLEDCEFALLFSSVMAVPFYKELGWRAIHGRVICDQVDERIDYTQRLPTAPVMILTKESTEELPAGPIDVRGFPW